MCKERGCFYHYVIKRDDNGQIHINSTYVGSSGVQEPITITNVRILGEH